MLNLLAELKATFRDSGYTDAGTFLEVTVPSKPISPRTWVSIQDSGEALIELPKTVSRFNPHPYHSLGAPYGGHSPFYVREQVAKRLALAQQELTQRYPGYQLKIFDAYRPLAVQAFMIQHEGETLAQRWGWDPKGITADQEVLLQKEVRKFWAAPDEDPTRPPPHSTGAAVDLTVVDDQGRALAMGVPIDHVGPESFPHFYADREDPTEQDFFQNRCLLNKVMSDAGFRRLPTEWWHFSYGDQWWALMETLEQEDPEPVAARYGRIGR